MDLPLPDTNRPAFHVTRPDRQLVPVVFVSAHSGSDYPAEFLLGSRLDALALRRSEDGFVDELFGFAPAHGAPLLAADFPRAYCDANREKWELDPAMFAESLPPWVNSSSARVGAGLGTIARVVATGEGIYRTKLPFAEAEHRLRRCWQPFHDALSALVQATRAAFGACLVIDCHSMPATGTGRQPPPEIVLGDAHGTACAAGVTRMAEDALAGLGFTVRRNDPYAGGYITRHYGRPRHGVHALQVEISRALYMDEVRVRKLPGFERVQGRTTAFVARVAEQAASLLA